MDIRRKWLLASLIVIMVMFGTLSSYPSAAPAVIIVGAGMSGDQLLITLPMLYISYSYNINPPYLELCFSHFKMQGFQQQKHCQMQELSQY